MSRITLAELEEMVAADPQHRRAGQLATYRAVLAEHPEAVLLECSDEKTGCRFGNATKRYGMCRKVGSRTFHYQLWASWAPVDVS